MTWEEVQGAIHAGFAALDTDSDNTLDRKEAAKAGIKSSTLRAADPDRDGTLEESEYMRLAKQRFDAADRDHDGTLSRRGLDNTAAGHALTRMLQVMPPQKPE